jgi:hypothetical protein
MPDWGSNMKKDEQDLATVIVLIILAIVSPILTLLALNTLFPVLAIPYTFGTWLATSFLILVIRAKVKKQ